MIYTNWKAAELKKLILAVTCLVVFLSAVSASFATQFAVGYNLRISEDLNVLQNPDSPEAQMMAAWTTPTALANQRNHPYLLLENTATTDNRGSGNAALTTFSITVGDPVMNYDWARIISTSSGVTATLVAPDTLENGLRGNAITYNFSGLTPGKQVIFQVDIDPNATNGDQFADYRQVLFHVSPSGGTSGSRYFAQRDHDGRVPRSKFDNGEHDIAAAGLAQCFGAVSDGVRHADRLAVHARPRGRIRYWGDHRTGTQHSGDGGPGICRIDIANAMGSPLVVND